MTTEFINLEFPQELIDTKIVDDGVFEIATKRFVIDLNHIHKGKRIIFSYNKNWKIIKRDLREEAKLKGLSDRQIQLLEETVDNNYHSVSITQEQQQQQKEEQDSTTTDQKKKDDERQTYSIYKYSQGISLVESILINNIPYFIEINQDKKLALYKKISLTDIDIVPPERIEYLSKEYNFASQEEVEYFINLAKNETLDSIYQKVRPISYFFIIIIHHFIIFVLFVEIY